MQRRLMADVQQKRPVQGGRACGTFYAWGQRLGHALRHAQNAPTREVVAMMSMMVAGRWAAHDREAIPKRMPSQALAIASEQACE